jgi:hypothetical protein
MRLGSGFNGLECERIHISEFSDLKIEFNDRRLLSEFNDRRLLSEFNG